MMIVLAVMTVRAQIVIGGNVYGGGNEGDVEGNTRVAVRQGDLKKVFGGARMADVGGNAYVNIDGAHASGYMLINYVFGGNDIAGTIGKNENADKVLPVELTGNTDHVTSSWNAFVHISDRASSTEVKYTAEQAATYNAALPNALNSTDALTAAQATAYNAAMSPATNKVENDVLSADEAKAYNAKLPGAVKEGDVKTPAVEAAKTFIGQLFAGGNGEYYYAPPTESTVDEKVLVTHNVYQKEGDPTPVATIVNEKDKDDFTIPVLDKTYLDVQGGTIVYAHGGGNNATVSEEAVIHVDNPSEVVTELWLDANSVEKEANADGATNVLDIAASTRLKVEMGVKTAQEHIESTDFQIGRLFGGNNLADMAIRPSWNLQAGKIRNLYSGGNCGRMTSPVGILLEIDPDKENTNPLKIDNVYGGCRMADVCPMINVNGVDIYQPCPNLPDLDDEGHLKYHFPAQLSARVLVRGGDINNVYGGNDVRGKVWGGNAVGIYTSIRGDVYGGGNGAYAYTDLLADDEDYSDFYYDPGSSSVEALNAIRPNAEQVSIRLKGTADNPTVIRGSVYVGGNCASLATTIAKPMVELKIGNYVLADKVFLGNNGEKMVEESTLEYYANQIKPGFSNLDLTDADKFASYMEGVVMNLQPSIVFDSMENGDPDDYDNENPSKIGSFYCGGNVGSMAIPSVNEYTVDHRLVIFEKFVAGCNNADVKAREGLNAAYDGGVLGASSERADYTDNGQIKDRIKVDLANLTIEPLRWTDTFTKVEVKKLVAGNTYYTDSNGSGAFTADGTETVNGSPAYYEKIGSEYVLVNPNTLIAGQEYYETDLSFSKFIADGTEVFKGTETAETYYEVTARGNTLEWNTAKWSNEEGDFVKAMKTDTDADEDLRLVGGNVYGGCYNSGHVNGNVVINIKEDLLKKDDIFAEADATDPYEYKEDGERRSGVLLEAQGDDVMAVAMSVFGAGYGEESEIWGSTTINHTNGYVFQIFGGGEQGVVGKKNGSEYEYNPAYSTTVNINGEYPGYSGPIKSNEPLAECEYVYGAGNEGDVCGDSYVYLGDGRVYDAFGGACNADVYGHTEVYIGHNGGFPWIRDNVYGGNDFGGTVWGQKNFINEIRKSDQGNALTFEEGLVTSSTYVRYLQGRVDRIFGGSYGNYDYTDPIFKDYVYTTGETLPAGKTVGSAKDGFNFPHLADNSFVHFRPAENPGNVVSMVLGGSEGYPGDVDMNNAMQQESYALIDDTETTDADRYALMDVYGGGAYAGVGTAVAMGAGRTVVDLYAGNIHNVYGGCNQEGLVGYTRVNVPSVSTVNVNALFGGGKGYDPALFEVEKTKGLSARYCDHYVTCVDYQSENAIVADAIYGGNENCRISCDTYINIMAPVNKGAGLQATIYGAGYGKNTVSGRTNVFMNNGSNAYKVFGGGRDGNAFNFASLRAWLAEQFSTAGSSTVRDDVEAYGDILRNFSEYISGRDADPEHDITALPPHPISLPSGVGTYVNASGVYDGTYTNDIMPTQEKPMPDYHQTNVHLMKGSNVTGYAYGGGFGSDAVVAGTTYLELKGGNVERDIYGGGQGGSVFDEFGLSKLAVGNYLYANFVASTNVYIEGGMARNVYGGGYLGHVGKHTKTVNDETVDADISDPYTDDIPGVANVIIGKKGGTSFIDGIPAILRNVYGAGEGGSVWGTTNVTMNNGYIGYRYKNMGTIESPVDKYEEELNDQVANDIEQAGNIFGGGYVVNSYVDIANVDMYGGIVRGCIYGGGEVGPIGRGTVRYKDSYSTGLENGDARIFKGGATCVKMYSGHVLRNVFGGGRGKDSWGGDGTMYMDDDVVSTLDLDCKGFVFGKTEVYIHGGNIGNKDRVNLEEGNVFGGGDEGFVYSATGSKGSDGYYYESGSLTEDCKVVISPHAQVMSIKLLQNFSKTEDGKTTTYYEAGDYITEAQLKELEVTLGRQMVEGTDWELDASDLTAAYKAGDYVPTDFMNHLTPANAEWKRLDNTGILIANAVFAGGNISAGSDKITVNTKTVFGNVTASVTDVFCKDLITIGEDGVGGLYGDGHFTFVDGYRELNITNYGTDYYNLDQSLELDEYYKLTDRERAYFELLYSAKRQRVLRYYESKGTHTVKINGVDVTFKLGQKIEPSTYDALPDGEKDNWQGTKSGETIIPKSKTYEIGARITQEEYNLLWESERSEENWSLYGFCTLYAGRMINTIQRADFCGVFGSRVVMRGAQDRVPTTLDYTEYSINRVKEVSLNMEKYPITPSDKDQSHGNYFGIYNMVNYLGALTSDVDFYNEARKTTNTDDTYAADGSTTYSDWKKANLGNRKRNNGSSSNEVALASGVWLELLDEETETQKKKVYGPITGVVELTLINVAPGEGGGYVYAKNIHGERKSSGKTQVTLAAANQATSTHAKALSYKIYDYNPPITPSAAATDNANNLTTDINGKEPGADGYIPTYNEGYPKEPRMESSGNFVNPLKRIIDDCYPQSGAYYTQGDKSAAPAHYWYIRGDYYVYDQYISAFTGSAQAFAETVSIPLTITPESQGKLTLQSIQPNHYAYWTDYEGIDNKYKSLVDPDAIVVGGLTYKLNEPISHWAWSHLSDAEKSFFTSDTSDTWVCSNDATYGDHEYKKGDIFTSQPADIYVCKYDFIETVKDPITGDESEVVYQKGDVLEASAYDALSSDSKNNFAAVFNVSNAVNHENGFLLTFDWDNPDIWNDYYHSETADATIRASVYKNESGYIPSPSLKFNGSETDGETTVLGQISYSAGDVIDATTYQYQVDNISNSGYVDGDTQAKFDKVYVAVTDHSFTANGVSYVPNACISAGTYNATGMTAADKANFDEGMLCTKTYQYTEGGDTKYVVAGTVIPLGAADGSQKGTYKYFLKKDENAGESFSAGYICTDGGKWGGKLFTKNRHYPAISYSNLSKDERDKFAYNYDALDLLVDQNYQNGDMSQYDKPNTELYHGSKPIDYEATYTGTNDLVIGHKIDVTYYEGSEKKKENTNTIKTGYVISNTDYEDLINEAANYTPIVITPKHEPDTTYYVVKTGFQVGDKWFSEGNQVTYAIYDGLSNKDKENITPVTFESLTGSSTEKVSEIQQYYYCTRSYEAITPVTQLGSSTPFDVGATIPVATIIPKEGDATHKAYDDLINQQKDFSIDGKTPTETSTLYVSREVDINSLSQDRIITVVYHYDYLESDDTGNSYEKIREYHVVNVHVHFESGMPTIGELMPPGIVLPDQKVNLTKPSVSKGAYEILGGGWEVFPDAKTAETHKNGVEFGSGSTPVYWYQDGYYVTYYALSYLGKSYSNAVPLSVANYHRMNDVLDVTMSSGEPPTEEVTTTNNYMYLNEAVKSHKRNPKVYVKDDNELKKLATFFNQTLSEPELSDIIGCKKIDFIIDGDIQHTITDEWTPIGREDDPSTSADERQCFEGTVHGDGHTISGLDHSLFLDLCGSVYNLGVTGSFNTAGVVDRGTGYVESAWVKSTAPTPLGTKPYAVFGNPEDGTGYQVVNSYFWDGNNDLHNTTTTNGVTTSGGARGNARAMTTREFYNGTVAYNLNNFYLHKRYANTKGAVDEASMDGRYFTIGDDGNLTLQPYRQYSNSPNWCSSGYVDNQSLTLKYVEDRYADGDFRYAGGEIPTDDDQRLYNDPDDNDKEKFYPIWPDDYIFFGQKLTYGYSPTEAHQDVPTAVVKDATGRLSETSDANRVYRAPAYYRSSALDAVHFNPNVYLAQKEKLTDEQIEDGVIARDVYPGMTAIDFAGHEEGHTADAYKMGQNGVWFYPPLLDDDGLQSIVNKDETQNLLVYAPAASSNGDSYANAKTYTVLNSYFQEPAYVDYYDNTHQYRLVANTIDVIPSIKGHLVQSELTANSDHLLVDKQDFNAPIEYSFDDTHRMWYQRLPRDIDNYVGMKKNDKFISTSAGWEGVSLPFTAELVTTDQKGEITHFYSGSENSKNDTGTKIGHEYWLREFTGVKNIVGDVMTANFTYPNALSNTADNRKVVTNHFLWDYYYNEMTLPHQKDANDDDYLKYKTYYKDDRSYDGYSLMEGAKSYIIGLPGERYYEFDLSGIFAPTTTGGGSENQPGKLDAQTITFASKTGISVGVSDNESGEPIDYTGGNKYTFRPNYLNNPKIRDNQQAYLLSADGDSYVKVDGLTPAAVAFRPFFTGGPSGTRTIVFGNDQLDEQKGVEEHGDPTKEELNGGLRIWTKKDKIFVESSLKFTEDMRVVTPAGITVATFSVKPGQTVEVQADFSGMYIVHTLDGLYTKKVTVRK